MLPTATFAREDFLDEDSSLKARIITVSLRDGSLSKGVVLPAPDSKLGFNPNVYSIPGLDSSRFEFRAIYDQAFRDESERSKTVASRLMLVDLTKGNAEFRVTGEIAPRSYGSRVSPAALALGLSQAVESTDSNSRVLRIDSVPLHGKTSLDTTFIDALPGVPREIRGQLDLNVKAVNASANIGLVGLRIQNGEGFGRVSAAVQIQDPNRDSRVTLRELLDGTSEMMMQRGVNPQY